MRIPVNENYRIKEKPGTYIFYARDAAKNERRGNYALAADAWHLAELRALNPVNQQFAKARHEFCSKAMESPAIRSRGAV